MLLGGQAACAAISVGPSSLPGGTVGIPYNESFSASGGTSPYTFSVTAGALPSGLSLDSASGQLSGTPSAQGVYNFSIQATDATSATGTRAYTMSIGTFSLAVQPNTLPNGVVGTAYNQALTAVGGTPPYTFSVSSGSLPPGLTLSSSGGLTGTPTTGGTFTFIIQALDPDGDTGYRTYNLAVGSNSITITPTSLANGTQSTAYSQSVSASGGNGGPYTYAISAGALPTGLSLDANSGSISGTPSAGGAYSFSIRATDSSSNFGSQTYNVTIGSNSLTLSPSSLPNGTVSAAYSQTIAASGGIGAPYTYSISAGTLPTGLSLNSASGAITGTPTAAGPYSFTVHAVDGSNNFANQNYNISIGTNSLTVNPTTLTNGTQTVAYNQTVSASGGTAPYSYAVTTGSLPNGLTLNTGSGVISGTPTAAGNYSFTMSATDSSANTGSRAYTVNIAPVPLTVGPSTLPNGTQSTAYAQTISASGGTGPYSYSVQSGSLPTGLSLNPANGQISGTPTTGGTFAFAIQATDSTSNTGSRSYSVTIGTNSLTVSPSSLPNATQGTAYSSSITTSGGTAPYSYAVTSGALPAGLSLNPTNGAITGTPSGSGTSNFTITATDSSGNTGSRAYALNVGTSSLSITPAALPNGTQGTAYNQALTATGGTAPYTFAVSAGTLPAGLSLSSAGILSGTPTANGSSSFTVRVTDSGGNVGTRSFALNIGTNSLTVAPTSLPNGTHGAAYNQAITATGGTAPYTFAVTTGALPAGMVFSTAGILSGTPTGNGASSFTIQATDANGNTGSKAYSINVGTSSLTVGPTSLANPSQGLAYSQTLTASGGTGSYTFTLASGALPAGLTINPASGLISGTPTGNGTSTFSIRATDANGNTGTSNYTLGVGGNILTINPASLPSAAQGQLFTQLLSVVGGTGPYVFSVVSGSLPPGITSNASTGLLTGTPSASGNYNFTIQARDLNGNFGTRSYALSTVRADPTTDPDVRGIIDAQAASARRFTDTQTSNVLRRLEGLHDGFNPCGLNFGINPTTFVVPSAYPADPHGSVFPQPSSASGALPRPATPASSCDPLKAPPIAVWASGALEFGRETNNGALESNKFSTSGLTAGVDARLRDNLIVGAAVGYGLDHTDIGLQGTVSNAINLNGIVYASFKSFDSFYLDAVAGLGSLGYTTNRYIMPDNAMVSGVRGGDTWFGSLSATYEFKQAAYRLAPYARIDLMTARLNQYSENGDPTQTLTYLQSQIASTSGVAGVRGSVDISDGFNIFTPNFRIEYQHAFDQGFTQSMYYNDIGSSQLYNLAESAVGRDLLSGAIGLRAHIGSSGSFELEYSWTGTPSRAAMWQSQTLRASGNWSFSAR